MPAAAYPRGTVIDLGHGVSAVLADVGGARVRFRLTLPPGVDVRKADQPAASAPVPFGKIPSLRRPRPSARTRVVGLALWPGEAVVIGERVRVRLKAIKEPARRGDRTARLEVTEVPAGKAS